MSLKTISASALYWNARTVLAWVLALVAFVYFAISDDNFLSFGNIFALTQIYSTLALVASGLAIVMLAGEFDLSIAGMFPLAGLIAVRWADQFGVPLAVALALAVGVLIGLVNGFLTSALRIPSLAVTVGTMIFTVGLGFVVTNSDIVRMVDYRASLQLTEPILGIFSIVSLLQLGLAILALIYLKTSWRGRLLYAVGSDAPRARASGLPVTGTIVIAFTISATFTSVGGALEGLSLASGQAGLDDAFLLKCATAALVGGVALTGGRGCLAGVLGGALLLAIVSNGLGLAGVDASIILLVNGFVLFAVVLLNGPIDRLIGRRLRGERAAFSSGSTVAPGITATIN